MKTVLISLCLVVVVTVAYAVMTSNYLSLKAEIQIAKQGAKISLDIKK